MLQLSGVHTALVTPFQNDELDLPTFRALIRRQLDAGVHGLVPCGTTGETPTLSLAEWEALLIATVEEANGRVPVTVGVGTNATRSTVERTRRARELGATAGLLVLPYYNKPTPAGLRLHVQAAAEVGLPLVVYHVPGRTAQRLNPELLAELCELPGVVACKEATGDLMYVQDLLLLTQRAVLSGDDFTWLPALTVGVRGVISVLSNIAPADTVAVWDAFCAHQNDAARDRHRALYPLVRYLFAQTNPVPAKAALAAMGLCAADCRLPLTAGNPPPPSLLVGRQ